LRVISEGGGLWITRGAGGAEIDETRKTVGQEERIDRDLDAGSKKTVSGS
jgi:hypothetical protein